MDCSDPGCNGTVSVRGMCARHYEAWKYRTKRDGTREPTKRILREGCAVDACTQPHSGMGYCSTHYSRVRRRGDPLAGRARTEEAARFWAKVDKNGPVPDLRPDLGPCWIWTGATGGGEYDLYGRFFVEMRGSRAEGRKNILIPAHRWAYEQKHGPIPDGLDLDHLCFNPPCVNDGHLEPVTPEENNRRSWDRRRLVAS